MADSNEEKTEKPTAKKRKDARDEGNIFQSKDVTIVASLIICFCAFRLLFSMSKDSLTGAMKSFFNIIGTKDSIVISDTTDFFIKGAIVFIKAAVPLLVISMAAGIIATAVQTKGFCKTKQLKPKFSRMNPLNGIKNIISLKGILELIKSILKISVLFIVIYISIRSEIYTIPKMFDMTLEESISTVGRILWSMIVKIIIAYVFIAGFDFLYQRWSYEKKLKMTKQEVKEEFKNTEGDPKIKGKIKSKQQEMSRRRMMQAVPQADVVIRNPTHYAVALKYIVEKNNAPVVVAKGSDNLALKIIEIAEQYNIAIVENKPLARALYAEVDIDREIPQEFYNPVAEVLAYVYSLKEKDRRKT